MRTQELQSAIKKLKKVISTRNVLPILDYIMNDNGTLTASDLETTHTINVGFPGQFLVDAKELSRIVDKLPKDADINVIVEERKITIDIEGMGQFKLSGGDLKEFPEKPKVDIHIGKLLESDILLMRTAAKFAGTDDLRPVMTGVYLEKKIVASDAHKLVYFDYSRRLNVNVLIPASTVKFLDAVDYTVYTNEGYKNVMLVNKDESIIIRQIDGNYPQYRAVIPKNDIVYVVNNKDLQESIKLAMIAANPATELVRFDFTRTTLTVTGQDLDFDRSFVREIPVRHPLDKDEPILIGFKGSFLLSLLAECKKDVVVLSFSDPLHAMIIDNDKLLMPMIIT